MATPPPIPSILRTLLPSALLPPVPSPYLSSIIIVFAPSTATRVDAGRDLPFPLPSLWRHRVLVSHPPLSLPLALSRPGHP